MGTDAEAGHVEHFTRAHVDLPGMPGTDHNILFQIALAQRAVLMWALVIQAVELAPHVKQRQFPAADRDDPALSGRQLRRLRHFHQRHTLLLSSIVLTYAWGAPPRMKTPLPSPAAWIARRRQGPDPGSREWGGGRPYTLYPTAYTLHEGPGVRAIFTP